MSDELIYHFADTNVLVYAYDRMAAKKHDLAKALLQKLWLGRQGGISIQVLQEFYVTITRKLAVPVTIDIAAQIITDLGSWKIHSPGVNDILAAIEIQRRYQISFWDAMIVRSAVQLGCEIIWSEDLNPGQVYDGVKVLNPFASS